MNEIVRPLYFFLAVVANPQLNHFKPTTLSRTVAHLLMAVDLLRVKDTLGQTTMFVGFVRPRAIYGGATISRLLKIIGLFCRISSLL